MNKKVALVTGASRGFGAAMAEELAANDYHVIALARTVGALEELDDRIQAKGGAATLVPLDICDEEGLKRLCLFIHERWGQLDLWAHCAIFAGPLSPAGHIPVSDWDKTLAVNIRATQRLVEMLDPLLKPGKGTAILPVDTKTGVKFHASYGAAKAAQKAIWDSWAAESAKTGPQVVTVAPKPMPTAVRARFYPGEDRTPLAAPLEEARRLLNPLM